MPSQLGLRHERLAMRRTSLFQHIPLVLLTIPTPVSLKNVVRNNM